MLTHIHKPTLLPVLLQLGWLITSQALFLTQLRTDARLLFVSAVWPSNTLGRRWFWVWTAPVFLTLNKPPQRAPCPGPAQWPSTVQSGAPGNYRLALKDSSAPFARRGCGRKTKYHPVGPSSDAGEHNPNLSLVNIKALGKPNHHTSQAPHKNSQNPPHLLPTPTVSTPPPPDTHTHTHTHTVDGVWQRGCALEAVVVGLEGPSWGTPRYLASACPGGRQPPPHSAGGDIEMDGNVWIITSQALLVTELHTDARLLFVSAGVTVQHWGATGWFWTWTAPECSWH